MLLVFRLKEVRPAAAVQIGRIGQEIGRCFQESWRFLVGNTKALQLIFLNAAVGSAATLLRFFLQARLPEDVYKRQDEGRMFVVDARRYAGCHRGIAGYVKMAVQTQKVLETLADGETLERRLSEKMCIRDRR